MFANYLAAALRNLVRNRLYAIINIVGLTVGFAAALLIALFVREELTYDRWIPGSENVYRVGKTAHPPNAQTLVSDGSGLAEAAWFKQDIPEVQNAVRLVPEARGVRNGAAEYNEVVVWADADMFEVFTFRVIDGDLSTALQNPDSIVVTQKTARKYFGRDKVAGETLTFDQKFPMRITAVIKDLPSRTHLNLDIVASARSSLSPMSAPYEDGPGMGASTYTYIRILPGRAAAVHAQLPDLINRHVSMTVYSTGPAPIAKPGTQASELYSYNLQSIADIHLMRQSGQFSSGQEGTMKPRGDRSMVMALAVTAVFILIVAVANFTNLMTARAGRRAGEVGVRKSVGAQRRDLVMQFMGESFLYITVAFVLAVLVVVLALPAFNAFLGRETAFDPFAEPVALLFSGALLIVVGLLGGLYPAFVLAAFHPIGSLKGGKARGRLFDVRHVLVIAQFAILIGLMVATSVIARQTTFAVQEGLKLDTDQLVFIETECREAFRNQVAAMPGVSGAACATPAMLGGMSAVSLDTLPDGTRINVFQVGMDTGLLELFGVKLLAGRLFAENDVAVTRATVNQRRSVVLNESAARAYGYASPEAAIGRGERTVIIGVVEDFPTRSIREAIAPTVFYRVAAFSHLAVKLRGEMVGETLESIDRAWKETGAERPIVRQFYNQHVQERYADITRQTQALSAFSAVGVLIACLGLFGLSAFSAEQRTKEIGVRKAMGAKSGDLLRLFVWQFTTPVLWANLVAWPVAFVVMRRWLEGFAYHIELSPWTFLAASGAALTIAVLTVSGHAWLVAHTQPVHALRYE